MIVRPAGYTRSPVWRIHVPAATASDAGWLVSEQPERDDKSELVGEKEPVDGAVGPHAPAEFHWKGRQEVVVYFLAMVSFVGLGVLLRTVLLNWIVGPLYFVMFIWTSERLITRFAAGPG